MGRLFVLICFLISSALLTAPEAALSQERSTSGVRTQVDRLKKDGRFDEAIGVLSPLVHSGTITSTQDRISLHEELGLLFWNAGRVADSLGHYERAEALARAAGVSAGASPAARAIAIIRLYNTGKKAREDKDYPASIHAFGEAVDIARKIGSPDHEAKCLRQWSLVYWETNDAEKFFELNNRALSLARSRNIRRETSSCLINIGIYHYGRQDFLAALKYYEEALRTARNIPHVRAESEALTNLGVVYKEIGDYDRALSHFRDALAIDETQFGASYIASDLNNLGTVYRKKGLLDEDRGALEEALRLFTKSLALIRETSDTKTAIRILNNVGTALADLKEYEAALPYYEDGLRRALASRDTEAAGAAYNNIGIVRANLGEDEAALSCFQKAVESAGESTSGEILWEAYLEMANVYRKQDRLEESLKRYRDSVAVIERSRAGMAAQEFKASYLGSDRRIEPFHNIVETCFALHARRPDPGRLAEAFEYSEKGKARAFLDSFVASSAGPGSFREPEIVPLKTVQDELLGGEKTVLVSYVVGKDRSFGIAITAEGIRMFSLPPRSVLQNEVRAFLRAISDPAVPDHEGGTGLYRELVLPALDRTYDRLVICPDDILHFLPFEALTTGPRGERLVEYIPVHYAPSVSALWELWKREKARASPPTGDIFGMGNPDQASLDSLGRSLEPGSGLDLTKPISYSGKEIEGIRLLFGSRQSKYFQGAQASEAVFKSQPLDRYKIIHLATHAVVSDAQPVLSAILLPSGAGSSEDGLLQTREIARLGLSAYLVTLSACRTALGKLVRGEGIEGMHRAFFTAGASSVLMSLWAVDDRASARLMERFYGRLTSGITISDALRLAKIEMIRSPEFSHPYFWAPFIVSGNAAAAVFPRRRAAAARAALGLLLGAALLGSGLFIRGRRRKKICSRE